MDASHLFRYRMSKAVAPADVEATLLRAILAVESLHGESETRMEVRHAWDESGRICVLDASTTVGRDLSRLFTGFLLREYGADGFRVERISLHEAATDPLVGNS